MKLHLRRAVQAFFLLFFLFLFLSTEPKGGEHVARPVSWFMNFDPLLMLATLLSGHALVKATLLSLATLAATALLGRVFCGWVCPLGTLNHMVGALRKRPRLPLARRWLKAKYLLLLFLLSSSLFGLQLTGIFDPLSLLVRSLTLGAHPALNQGINAGLDLAYKADAKALTQGADAVSAFLRKSVLAFAQPHFHQTLLIGGLLALILGLNLLERRFWCRYLCPLGALLGLVGRWAPFHRRLSGACNGCAACDRHCQGAAGDKGRCAPAECMVCMNCTSACAKGSLAFGFGRQEKERTEGLDLGRREVLAAGVSGAVTVALARSGATPRESLPNPGLIRPPGSQAEPAFLAKCVKCGACMKVCTTNGLQPTLFQAGPEGIWTPMLVPRMGYCEYGCTLCGQVCPTGAIKALTPEAKAKVKIGTAMFDRTRCLPWAHATPCIVCEEMCPVPGKAIWYETVTARDRDGQEVELKQPRVDMAKCIGCGVCESKCPIVDKPGIRVTSIGETRSEKNQLLIGSGGYGG